MTVKAGNDADTTDDTVTLTHSATSTDTGYQGIMIASVDVTVTDNDTHGVKVSKQTLTVEEEDTTGGSYTVALSAQPTAVVTVTVEGHSDTDVTPSPTTLTFTSLNWATAQTVTVKAANDADTDDDTVTLTHSAASADTGYHGINIASVTVTVADNDIPLSSEARLSSLALSGVTLVETFDKDTQSYTATAATDATETTVTATPFDSDATTVIKLNGVEDADGTVGLELGGNIITVEVTAEDGTMKTYTVTVTIQATISFQSEEYYVSEGDSVEVTMVLSHARPGNDPITFELMTTVFNSTPDDYTLPESITFGANQTSASFTITATQDTEPEPDEQVEIYFPLPMSREYLIYGDPATTLVTIVGDDTPGMTITPRTLDVDEGGTTMYTVKLNGLPTENVTVTIASNNPGAATVSPASLTFTSQNWATAQTVTVTGVEDSDMNDEIVTLSNDPSGEEYYNISTVYVKLNVADNDSSGVNVSTTALTVREEDTTGDSYTLVLFTPPTADVTVTVAGYSGTDVTPSPTTLTFTSQNWETAQTVTVKAANDADRTNDFVTLTHSAMSTDPGYQGITIASVAVTVTDNDTPLATEARLLSLALSGVTLAETFDKDIQSYTATAAAGITETTVTATPLNSDATTVIKLNGTEDADGTVDLELGENTITVEVTAEDGTTIQTYTVTITLMATVSFQSGEYNVSEGDAVEVTVVLSQALPDNATITFPLSTTDDGSMPDDYTLPENITFGANETSASFTITATQDTDVEGDELVVVSFTLPISGENLTYGEPATTLVTIIDDDTPLSSEARLRSLALSGVTLAEPFDNDIQSYTATAAAGITETTVTATPLNSDATTVIKLNGTEDADGTVDLELGENTITVEVTAEDGTTTRDLYRHHHRHRHRHAGCYGKLRERGILCV